MTRSVFIFVPDTLSLRKNCYLVGLHRDFGDCEAFYVAGKANGASLNPPRNCIGYVGSDCKKLERKGKAVALGLHSGKVTLVNVPGASACNLVRLVYDYEAFCNSELVNWDSEDAYGKHFRALTETLKRHQLSSCSNGRKDFVLLLFAFLGYLITIVTKVLDKCSYFTERSATLSHLLCTLSTWKWVFSELLLRKKLSPKVGNIVVAKALDLLLGILLFRHLLLYETEIVDFVAESRESTISKLRELLTYLMGAPIGLKLNFALNQSLATFFYYHLILWRVFLNALQPVFAGYYLYLILPGMLGLTFQFAMLSDVVAVATFHVYCIHVYAARLINLQLRGLLSLWRLFIGRKYNPLRQRVDSYQYSQHQLFIGTLGFTVLVFLLPTVLVYYVVFTVFRFGVILIDEALSRLRYLLSCLPLYVVIMWVFKSSSLAGTLYLKVVNFKDGIISFEAHLITLPLGQAIRKFNPDVIKPVAPFLWSKVLTGIIVEGE